MSTGESICDEMRAGCADIWDGLHAHPFLRELAAGTLALEKFRFFLEQDIFYLVDYVRCLAMGAADRGGALMMAPANVAYTSYMQALALRGGPLEIMAALLPCAWSYVEIAERLAGEGGLGQES